MSVTRERLLDGTYQRMAVEARLAG